MESPKIIFHAKTINYKCWVSLDVIELIPAIKIALTKFGESKSQKYVYGGETTEKAIKAYLRWKKSKTDKTQFVPDPSLSDVDWKYVMFLAVHMADFSFFEDGPELPSLEFMVQEIPNLPTEGLIPYLEQYLTSTFLHKIEWPGYQKRVESLDWLKYRFDRDVVKDSFEMVVTATRLVYGVLEPEILINMKFDTEKLKHANIDLDYYNQIMEGWANKYYEHERQYIVYAYYNYEKFKIGTNFYYDWTNFFSKQPILAKLIWNSMDRSELLRITNCSYKRRGTSAKLNFEEMQEYVQRFAPKENILDPTEEKLKAEVIAAKQGERVGRTARYIDSEEVAMAEAKLEGYQASRRRKMQQKESKVSEKPSTCTVITPKIQFNFQMCKQRGFRVHKL